MDDYKLVRSFNESTTALSEPAGSPEVMSEDETTTAGAEIQEMATAAGMVVFPPDVRGTGATAESDAAADGRPAQSAGEEHEGPVRGTESSDRPGTIQAHVCLMEADDMEAYLTTFEGLMMMGGIAEESWAIRLASQLTGKA